MVFAPGHAAIFNKQKSKAYIEFEADLMIFGGPGGDKRRENSF